MRQGPQDWLIGLVRQRVRLDRFWFFPMLIGLAFLVIVTPAIAAGARFDRSTCTYGNQKLYGKVQVVSSFPDLTVQVVTSFPDLKVEVVTSFPDRCGEWQFVESFPDLKIQFVESFPDLKIQFVTSFPGVSP